jgi:hypothetical protein
MLGKPCSTELPWSQGILKSHRTYNRKTQNWKSFVSPYLLGNEESTHYFAKIELFLIFLGLLLPIVVISRTFTRAAK